MIDKSELEKIRKLPAKERFKAIEKLKKKIEKEQADEKKRLEEKKKNQEEEANNLITESIMQLELNRMLEEIEVPKKTNQTIDKLFDDSMDLNQNKEERSKQGGTDYAKRLHELLPSNTLQEIHNWYTQDNTPPSKNKFLEVYESAREAYEIVQLSTPSKPSEQTYISSSDKVAEEVVSSMRLLRSLGYKMDWFGP